MGTFSESGFLNTKEDLAQPLPHLGQVGRFAHPVHTTKGDDKGPTLAFSLHHISEDIHPPLWLQDLHQRVLQGLLHCRGHSCKHTLVSLVVVRHKHGLHQHWVTQ